MISDINHPISDTSARDILKELIRREKVQNTPDSIAAFAKELLDGGWFVSMDYLNQIVAEESDK